MKELSNFNQLIDKYFTETSKEEISLLINEIDSIRFDGVTVDDYLFTVV
jgi:hypothetical protein